MNKRPLTYTIADHWRLRPMPTEKASIDAESYTAALPPLWFRQWSTPINTSSVYEWLEEYGLRSRDMEDGFTFGYFFVSLLFSSSQLWISAQYKWRRHGFLPSADGGGASLCAGFAERSPLSCPDRLWDSWVCTIAYVGWLLHSFFPCLLFSYNGFGSPGGLRLKRGIM